MPSSACRTLTRFTAGPKPRSRDCVTLMPSRAVCSSGVRSDSVRRCSTVASTAVPVGNAWRIPATVSVSLPSTLNSVPVEAAVSLARSFAYSSSANSSGSYFPRSIRSKVPAMTELIWRTWRSRLFRSTSRIACSTARSTGPSAGNANGGSAVSLGWNSSGTMAERGSSLGTRDGKSSFLKSPQRSGGTQPPEETARRTASVHA